MLSYGYHKGLKQQEFTQGHWKSCHSIGHTWFPVSFPL